MKFCEKANYVVTLVFRPAPGLQVAMHSPGDCEPCGSAAHAPEVVLQLYMTGVGAGVGGLVLPPHPFGTGAAKQPSHEACTVIHGLQQTSQTLHPATSAPHAFVPFSTPQLFGTTHLQLSMQSPGVSLPCCGSFAHWPIAVLQLYITGVGTGVGSGVGAGVGRLHTNSAGGSTAVSSPTMATGAPMVPAGQRNVTVHAGPHR